MIRNLICTFALIIFFLLNLEADFPDRRGFFTGHRIPLELFPEETLRNIELIGETTPKTVPTAKSTNGTVYISIAIISQGLLKCTYDIKSDL